MCDTDTVSGYVDLFNEDVLQPSTLQAIKELLTIEVINPQYIRDKLNYQLCVLRSAPVIVYLQTYAQDVMKQ